MHSPGRWRMIPGVLSGLGVAVFLVAWMEVGRVNALRAAQQAPEISISIGQAVLVFLVLQLPALIFILARAVFRRKAD